MKRFSLLVGLSVSLSVALLVLSASFAAEKWTAEKVIQKTIASYEKQMEKVNDITTITDKYTSYQKKAKVKGESLYKSRMEIEIMGGKHISIYDGIYQWSKDPYTGEVAKEKISYDPYQTWRNLAFAELKYKGTEEIDENKCHILAIEDMRKILPLKEYETEATREVSGKMWIDARDWVIRKMEIVIKEEDEEGEETTIKLIHKMGDYRKIDGMLVAYRQAVSTIIGAEEVIPDKRKEMEEGLKKMQEQLEKMPSAQRGMVEGMMKPRMEAMKKLLGEEDVTLVEKVEINTGLPDSLFDGKKLKSKKSD